MKTPHSTVYRYSAETIAAANKIPIGCVNEHSHKKGMELGEPLIIAADALLKFAEAYQIRFESGIGSDGVLGAPFKDALSGIRAMLDTDGAIALKKGITTDTKDNAATCDILEAACRFAGIDWNNL